MFSNYLIPPDLVLGDPMVWPVVGGHVLAHDRLIHAASAPHIGARKFKFPAVTRSFLHRTMSPAGHLDHWWVSEQWLIDVGLTQYASRFREHLIDGRTLASLTRRDLERYLGMEGKKQHQESALRGVQLLRMMEFNLEVCEDNTLARSCETEGSVRHIVWS